MTDSLVDRTRARRRENAPSGSSRAVARRRRSARAAGGWLRRHRAWAPPAVLTVAVVAQVVVIYLLSDRLWFVWGDDYDFFLLRGTVKGESVGLWAPHDDHWMTSVVLIDRLLFELVGLHSYLPYLGVTVAAHVGCVVLLYLLVRRTGGGPWVAVVTALVALCAGVGGGAILWNTAIGLVGSLFCGLLACWLGLRHDYQRRGVVLGWVALTVGLTFSGTGVVAVFVAAVLALLRRGWRTAGEVLSVPTLVFLVWYVGIGRTGAKAPLADPWDYLQVPRLIWTGLTSAPGLALAVPEAGVVVVLGLVAVTVFAPARVPRPLRDVALAGIAGALGQLTLAAVSRPSFGEATFTGGRYAYLTVVFLAPTVAVAITAAATVVTAPRLLTAGLAGWLLVLYVVQGQQLYRGEAEARAYVSESWPGIMKGLRDSAQAGETVLTVTPPVEDVHFRFRADLAAREEMWDALPTGASTPSERLNAERLFFVGVGTKSFGIGSEEPPRTGDGFASERAVDDECSTVTATGDHAVITVATGSSGAELGIAGPATSLSMTLEREGTVSPARVWAVAPDRGYWVATTAQDAELRVEVSVPGDYTICPL